MAEPYRVVVVDDDVDVANFTAAVLEKRGCTVITTGDPREVRAAVAKLKPDVVITDIEMPGKSGLELIEEIRAEQPGTPVVVMTAHVSVDYAVTALRNQANEFLTKPVSSADLADTVTRLAEEFRRSSKPGEPQSVLAIGAHPDDVEIGVGGILAAHSAAGDRVTVLTLSRGDRSGGIKAAWTEGSAAAGLISAKLVLEDNPDAHLSGAEPTVGIIARVAADVQPTIVYIPSDNDRNQDHRAVYAAAIAATADARTVACYQTATASVDFHPNRFVTVDGFTDMKLAMLACFAANGERPPHLEPSLALATARYWSRFGKGTYCEPLEIFRDSGQVA